MNATLRGGCSQTAASSGLKRDHVSVLVIFKIRLALSRSIKDCKTM